jgi:hypothetical protein
MGRSPRIWWDILAVAAVALLLFFWLDAYLGQASTQRAASEGLGLAIEMSGLASARGVDAIGLIVITVFLAIANLYLKLAERSEDAPISFSLRLLRSLPFVIYVLGYLLLSFVAWLILVRTEVELPRLVLITSAALIGVGAGNTDIQFGGFSVLPLVDFIRNIEAAVVGDLLVDGLDRDIARRSRLRRKLTKLFPVRRLKEECLLTDVEHETIERLERAAGENETLLAGYLAKVLIAASEQTAKQLIRDRRNGRRPAPTGDPV